MPTTTRTVPSVSLSNNDTSTSTRFVGNLDVLVTEMVKVGEFFPAAPVVERLTSAVTSSPLSRDCWSASDMKTTVA